MSLHIPLPPLSPAVKKKEHFLQLFNKVKRLSNPEEHIQQLREINEISTQFSDLDNLYQNIQQQINSLENQLLAFKQKIK